MAPLATRRTFALGADSRVGLVAGGEPDAAVRRTLARCRRLLATKGKSFALAARFLPHERRLATWALYAFFRTVDDIADTSRSPGEPAALARLDDWRRWVEAGCPPELADPVAQGPAVAAILVVDGGSRDGTQDLVRRYVAGEPRLRLIDASPVPPRRHERRA